MSAQLSNLYRSASNTLKTDGALVVGGTLAVTGAASASNLSGTNTGDAPLTVKDEGSNLDTAVTSVDFVGGGVTATNVSHAVTATIPKAANLALGAVGASPNANAATLSSGTLNLELADASFPGIISAANFSKLGGVAAGATAEVNADATHAGRVTLADQQLGTGVKSVEALELLNNTPSAPSAGKLRWFNKIKARQLAHIYSPTGAPSAVQSMLAFKRIDYQCAVGANNTTFTGFGTSSTTGTLNMTTYGTVTAAALATTNIQTAARRILLSTGTGAGTAGGVRCGTLKWWTGNAAGLGGFYFTTRFGFGAITLATSRWFVGLRGTTGAVSGGTEPSAQINSLIVGQDLADTTEMLFMWADASNTNNRQGTGITPAIGKVYELCIYVPPNGSTADFYIEECNTSTNYSYQVTTFLPATFLGEYFYIHNGSTGADYSIAYLYHYGESDYG